MDAKRNKGVLAVDTDAKTGSGVPTSIPIKRVVTLLGVNSATVRRRCIEGKYAGAFKVAGSGGDSWMVPIVALPRPAQQQLAREFAAELAARAGLKSERLSDPVPMAGEYRTLWDAYERKPGSVKQMAERAWKALLAYQELRDTGLSADLAKRAVAASHGVSGVTLWRYVKAVEKHPRQHWLPLLCPKYRGGRGKAEFTPEAYAWILSRYRSVRRCTTERARVV